MANPMFMLNQPSYQPDPLRGVRSWAEDPIGQAQAQVMQNMQQAQQATLLPQSEPRGGIMGRLADPRVRAMLAGMSKSFAEAGAPSLTPKGTGFGAALSAGIQGANTGMQSYEDLLVKRAAAQFDKRIQERQMAAQEATAGAAVTNAERDRIPADIQELSALGFDLTTKAGQQAARDYLTSQKAAGGVSVNVGGLDAGERDKKLAGVDAEQYASVEKDAEKADTLINQADRLESLLSDKNMSQGLSSFGSKWLGKGLAAVGIDVANSRLDPAQYEEIEAISKSLPSMLRSEGEGTMSDSDRKALESIVATLGNSQEANLAGVQALRKIADRKMEKADALGEWLQAGKPLYSFNRHWREYTKANPLFRASSGSVNDIKDRNELR